MSGYICRSCRMSMRRALRPPQFPAITRARPYNTITLFDGDDMRPMGSMAEVKMEEHQRPGNGQEADVITVSQDTQQPSSKRRIIDIEALLSKPTWSVRCLLPEPNIPPEDEISPEKLHHLLRLSALPLPKSPAEEAKMLETLHSQLHFVRDIQKVNTDGVEPLRSIRDETEEGIKEITIGMDQLKEAFAKEHIIGKNRRPRRIRGEVVDEKGVEDWDVLGAASETVEMNGARYFVVRSGPGQDELKSLKHRSSERSSNEEATEKADRERMPGPQLSEEVGSTGAVVSGRETK